MRVLCQRKKKKERERERARKRAKRIGKKKEWKSYMAHKRGDRSPCHYGAVDAWQSSKQHRVVLVLVRFSSRLTCTREHARNLGTGHHSTHVPGRLCMHTYAQYRVSCHLCVGSYIRKNCTVSRKSASARSRIDRTRGPPPHGRALALAIHK